MNRSGASLETNPVDVHRATDAVLAGVDAVARDHRNVVFIATTNFRSGVDSAFLSRADLIEEIGLPSVDAVVAILGDTLQELGVDPDARGTGAGLSDLASACTEVGLDARQIRKLVVAAACARRDLVLDPSKLTLDDVAAELDRIRTGSRLAQAATQRRG